jgi:hypothetical protein
MIEDELVKIWQSSPNQERVKFEKSRLMIDVQSSLDRFHRAIMYRDLREQVAILVVSPVFIYYAYTIPFLLTKIASILIVIWGVYVFIRLRNTRKHKPGALTENYLQYLHQKQLLDNVLYWYILPCMIFTFLFILGPGLAGRLAKIVKMAVPIAGMGVVIYYLNKRAVRKQFMPRLEKIDALIKVMEKE